MTIISRVLLKSRLSKVAVQLSQIYATQPEEAVRVRLTGTGWTYREWSFFHAAKPSYSVVVSDSSLARITKSANGDFRDYLLALAIFTDVSTRKAVFLSPDEYKATLKLIAEVVLERVPSEFVADNWLGSRLSAGVNAFTELHALEYGD